MSHCRRPLMPLVAGLLLALLVLAAPAGASPLGPDALGDPEGPTEQEQEKEAAKESSAVVGTAVGWLLGTQRDLHRALTAGVRDLRNDNSPANGAWLVLISFVYGVFHAAGPGHGKAVISTYLLTHRTALRRGILLSFASSLLQAITAILLVFGLVVLAGLLSRDAMQQVATVELVSFGLVSALGALLCLRAGRTLLRRRSRGHAHHHGCSCGHSHHVDPQAVQGHGSRWPVLATILSVGARPCTGAVLILVAANLMGLWTAGILAVLAMALGTALTVSALAVLAVQARGWASALVSRRGGGLLAGAGDWVALAGGLLILLMGMALFVAALGTAPAIYRL